MIMWSILSTISFTPLHRPLHTQIRIVENLTIVVIFFGGGGGLAEFGSQLIIK